MRDPYLYDGETVLKNKLNIHEQEMLDDAEADYVSLRLRELVQNHIKGNYHSDHLLKMHEYIFQDLYEWAGEPRVISIIFKYIKCLLGCNKSRNSVMKDFGSSI